MCSARECTEGRGAPPRLDGLRCGRALRHTAWAAFAAGRLAQQKPSKRGRFERAQPSKASEHVKISLQLVARLHNLAKHRGRFYILYRFVAMESMRVQSCRGRKPVSILFSHTFLIHFSYHSHTCDTHGAPWAMLSASGGASLMINVTF